MKIGLIAVGLNTYWHQFGGLRERLDGYRNAIKEKICLLYTSDAADEL